MGLRKPSNMSSGICSSNWITSQAELPGLGAAGAVSAIANIEPRLLLDLAESFGQPSGNDLQARLVAVRDRTKRGNSAIAAIKRELAGHLPGYPTHMRAPLA